MRWTVLFIFFTSCTHIPHYNLTLCVQRGYAQLMRQTLQRCKDESLLHMNKYVDGYYEPTQGLDEFSGMYAQLLSKCVRVCTKVAYQITKRSKARTHIYEHVFLKTFYPTCK